MTDVYMYLGPNIRGVIQRGTIFTGTKDTIINSLPLNDGIKDDVAKLIVPADEVAKAKKQIKEGGNPISHACRELLKTIGGI